MQYQDIIHEYLQEHQQEMLSVLEKLIAIPSVMTDPAKHAPFGVEPARALQEMMKICQDYGFQTEIIEDCVGSADLDNKTPKLGILSHLDVVPAGEGWTHEPYCLTYEPESDKLYGRGTSDDKAPAVASLFAIKAIKDLKIPLKHGVRLIFGTNEENGSKDLACYMQNRTLPPMVFTPDGDYPVINIEKGMIRLKFSAKFTDGKSQILLLQAGEVINAVPVKAMAIVRNISKTEILKFTELFPEIKFIVLEKKQVIEIQAQGKSAHASTPEQGHNALIALINLLAQVVDTGEQAECIKKLASCYPYGETDGKSFGISASDEISGKLTLVCSVTHMLEADIKIYNDIRFPICCTGENIIKAMQDKLAPMKCEVIICDEPHHTDENSEFVQTLLKIYEHVTGLKGECLAIGGGTYVHHIEGGVAFGATFPETDVHMHGADEFIKLKHFMLDAEMMALAITELCGK
ncbi:MAG: Sapep family Mn(2+)-dependent dipeptidase [Oscillospiraceae bacterium]|nr:Sapep family Mn(2+)-dependent dipeptidase [Oscillospiraceae bacterium]